MSNHNKPGGKSGQRKGKPVQASGPKANEPQSRKPDQPPSPQPMQLENQRPIPPLSQKPVQPESLKPIQPLNHKPVQPQSQKPIQPLNHKPVQPENDGPVPQQPEGNRPIAAAAASTRGPSIGFQAIATAYSDYTRKSFQETKAFVEKLSGARSLDKAIEAQTEYAKQAYETFVTESQKIGELYSDLAKQSFKPFDGLVAKTTRAAR
jgi:phasin family protein